jgi:hypothetical protein
MKFFSDRGVYNNDAHENNRLNERYNHIILPNLSSISQKRILDLGSHDGRWMWACLESGAAYVTGVEGRKETAHRPVTQLKQSFSGRYEIIVGDILDVINVFYPQQFDTILCLGVFYHILNHERLMSGMARLRPEVMIIDGGMIDTDDMIIRLQHEPTGNPLMGFGTSETTLVGTPSRGALEAIALLHGYTVRYIDWDARAIENHFDIDSDYLRRARFTAVLEPLPDRALASPRL